MDGREQQAARLLAAWTRFRRAQRAVYGDRGRDAGVRAEYAAARAELERLELTPELGAATPCRRGHS